VTTTTQNSGKAVPPALQDLDMRDYFAAKAMRVVSDDWQAEIEVGIFENFAHDCYSLADAMLAERAK